tara:strand:- start:634 stop:1083 length:450 start_codon:yes stop_codon:yes gene_type:complete
MRLTLHTDYALRVLISLAVAQDRRHTIEAISQRHGVSNNHLMKVTRTLTLAGFVNGVRGRNGGLELARPPEEIRVGEVVRVCEDNFALVDCFDASRNRCLLTPACGLRGPLEEALAAFIGVLDRYSLADLIARPGQQKELRQLVFPAET